MVGSQVESFGLNRPAYLRSRPWTLDLGLETSTLDQLKNEPLPR